MSKFINPWPQYLDENGNPYAGGTVFFGQPNQDPVNNPKAPFSDEDFQVPIGSSQKLDDRGMFQTAIYLSGFYSASLFDADNNFIRTVPDFTGNLSISEIETELDLSSSLSGVKPFSIVAVAIADTKLVDQDTLNIASRDTLDDGGGAIWDVVPLNSVTPTTRGIIACTGVPALAIVLRIESGIINVPSFGIASNSAVPDTALLLEVHAATGSYILYEKNAVYVCTEALKLRKGDEVNLNSAEVKFAVVGNIENFLMNTDTWLHNGTVTADNDPNGVSSTLGCKPVRIAGKSVAGVDPELIENWKISELHINGGLVFAEGVNRGGQAIVIRDNVRNGLIENITIDGRGLTNWGIFAEWGEHEFFEEPQDLVLPRNIIVRNITFENGNASEDFGYVVGCSGSYNFLFENIIAKECYHLMTASIGEAGTAFCSAEDAVKINTNIKFKNVTGTAIRGASFQGFGIATNALADPDPTGDIVLEKCKATFIDIDTNLIDGWLNNGLRRLTISDDSRVEGFSGHGVNAFNKAINMNIIDSDIVGNGFKGIFYNGTDGSVVHGLVHNCNISANGKSAVNDVDKIGVGLFFAENVKITQNKFGSGLGSTEGATQEFCVYAVSTTSPRYNQITLNYRDILDTGITHTWFSGAADNQANNELRQNLVHNNFLVGTTVEGSHLLTTDGL